MDLEQTNAEEASAVRRLLVGLVGMACRHPWIVLAVAIAVAAGSGLLVATRLEYQTQRSDLISSDKDSQRRWQRFVAEFGDDDDIVVVLRGTGPARMRAAIEDVAERVREQPGNFDRLFYKADLRHLKNRALQMLPSEQIRDIVANLKNMKALLDAGPVAWQWFLTFTCLMNEAQTRLDKLSPGQPLTPADAQFFGQLAAIARSADATLARPADYRSPWGSMMEASPGQEKMLTEPQYFFSGDGELAFLLARPVKEAGSFTGARRSVDALTAIVNDVRPAYPDLQIGLTGLPVLETDEMTASERDTHIASLLAFTGVALLNLLVFRGFRYPLLIMATIMLGTAWAAGWLTLTIGHLNILSATFVMMLIGMGDYGVIWVTRYIQERRLGADVPDALSRTAGAVGPGILTAAVTTALAFFAAMLADFHAVIELGWIAGCGVLLCAFACFTVMPALLRLVDRRPSQPVDVVPFPTEVRTNWLPALASRPRWVLAAGAGLAVVLGIFAARVSYDHNLLHLQAEGLDSVKWEMTLMEHTAGASWYALSYTDTPEQALALKARYEQLPGVSRVIEVASMGQTDQEAKLALLRDIQRSLRDLPARGTVPSPRLPSTPETLRVELRTLHARLGTLAVPGAPLALAELRTSLASLRDRLGYAEAVNGGGSALAFAQERAAVGQLRTFDEHLASDLAEDLHRLRDVATPTPILVSELPGPLRERFIGKTGKWLVRVFSKDDLWNYAPLQGFVEQVRTVDPEATGKPFGTLEGLDAMKNGFERAGLYALLVIVVVLLADFRKVGRATLALAPLGLGALLSLGIMGLFRLPFNPANMIAVPLVLGVGVNYGVYVLHDYLNADRRRGYTLGRTTGRGILVAALATMLGFGTLMISSHRGLVGLGCLLTLGVSCSMATALVFLPALLRLLSGRRVPSQVSELEQVRRAA